MLSSPNSRALSHESSRRPSERDLAIRFHCSGELSSQNSAVSVCSAVRALGVVTPSPPSALISLRSAAYCAEVSAYGGSGPELRRVVEHERRDLGPAGGEGERPVGREDPLAGLVALREGEVQQRGVRAVGGPEGEHGRRGGLPHGHAAVLRRAVRDRVERGRVVGLHARDAGVDARLRERRLQLAEHGHEHVARGGRHGGVGRRTALRAGVVHVRLRAAIGWR